MQVPILGGILADENADFRSRYPRNLVPMVKQTGISQAYLRPADGIIPFGIGPGTDRGGINWRGECYRVMGSRLVKVASDGRVNDLGDVGSGGQVSFDYSFDRLAIASGGDLYYWDGATLQQVTDPDLGTVVDMRWIAGYFLCTDGTNLIVTDLADPFAVNPLKYGSAESDPDPVLAVGKLRNEAYAFGRATIEVFQNVGGDNFPFARIEGAQIPRGIIGTHAVCQVLNTFLFVGSGRNEAPAVYLMVPGDTVKVSTREIDLVLAEFTEAELALTVVESRICQGQEQVLIHLPDRCLVYDSAASKIIGEPIWFVLTSSVDGFSTYRARGLVWCYERWIVGDPASAAVGALVEDTSTHYGEVTGWDFGTAILYGEGAGAVVHSLELVGLPGRVVLGANPAIWTSYSLDGQTWSPEVPAAAGASGERQKRIVWRRQGKLRNYRIQQFRGTSDVHMSFARLEAVLEPLNG